MENHPPTKIRRIQRWNTNDDTKDNGEISSDPDHKESSIIKKQDTDEADEDTDEDSAEDGEIASDTDDDEETSISYQLRNIIDNIRMLEDLDEEMVQMLFPILESEGESIMQENPAIFLQMVEKASDLIQSNFYKLTEDRPLESLVSGMDCKIKIVRYQEKLLLLIQVLVKAVDSSHANTLSRCLRMLVVNALHVSERGKPVWTKVLLDTLKILLEKGADPTWMPQSEDDEYYEDGESTLYYFSRGIIFILAEKDHENETASALMNMLPCFLTEKCMNFRDPSYPMTVLHALVDSHWKYLTCDLPANFSKRYERVISKVVRKNPAFPDITDHDGQTALHILAKTVYEFPDLGLELQSSFTPLTTKRNVNITDKDSVTPLSWILIAKARWGNNDTDMKVFSELEESFLSHTANENIARASLIKLIYKWVEEQFSDEKCTSDQLQRLLNCIDSVPDWNFHTYTREFDEEIWDNLKRLSNPKFLTIIMDIMRRLMTNESTAQHVWSDMIYRLIESAWDITSSVMEILLLCAESGAQSTDEELQKILSKTSAITRNEQLTLTLLKILVALHKNKQFTHDLNFLGDLGDFYFVSKEILCFAKQLVREVYGKMDVCPVKQRKLINHFLLISFKDTPTEPLNKEYFKESYYKNWFQRSPLHIAAIFLDGENALECLPQNIVQEYINKEDIHGCTPLHLAYLHGNKQAVQFLISNGAEEDILDKFGMSPKSLEICNTAEDQPDIKYHKQCCSILEAKRGVIKLLRPMVVHSEATALSDELKNLFQRLVRKTTFQNAKVFITGSMRDGLKAGCLDEADIQLRFEGYLDIKQLSQSLIKSLAIIEWEGINLRPISVRGPWKFIRERSSLYKGLTICVDVVPVIVYKENELHPYRLREELLNMTSVHKEMRFATLETWKEKDFFPTYFEYEWDIIDRLPASCRLAIVIAKALVQAYELCRGDSVKMPITSYTIKTALFYILANNLGQLHFDETDLDVSDRQIHDESVMALKKALESLEDSKSGVKTKPCKMNVDPGPKWATDEDLNQNGEEARIMAEKIFMLIKHLAKSTGQNKYIAKQGWKLDSFWDRWKPVLEIGGYRNKSFGEAEYVCDVCDCALERLNPEIFYDNDSKSGYL